MIHTITIMTCTTSCMLSISYKSSTTYRICLSGRDARITRVHSYKCHKHSLHCLSVSYKEYDQCYHKYNVACKGHIGEHD